LSNAEQRDSWLNSGHRTLAADTDVFRSTISQLDVTTRGNSDINTDGFGEGLADTVLWSAGNNQLEFFQVINLNPTFECIQKTLVIVSFR